MFVDCPCNPIRPVLIWVDSSLNDSPMPCTPPLRVTKSLMAFARLGLDVAQVLGHLAEVGDGGGGDLVDRGQSGCQRVAGELVGQPRHLVGRSAEPSHERLQATPWPRSRHP